MADWLYKEDFQITYRLVVMARLVVLVGLPLCPRLLCGEAAAAVVEERMEGVVLREELVEVDPVPPAGMGPIDCTGIPRRQGFLYFRGTRWIVRAL